MRTCSDRFKSPPTCFDPVQHSVDGDHTCGSTVEIYIAPLAVFHVVTKCLEQPSLEAVGQAADVVFAIAPAPKTQFQSQHSKWHA
eukprot:CAMPEP_0119299748 /NCGR_PEP_ID=MMETSP1333-20130426/1788_1 /TAXON_ID=418940 /ORGANISM="Scyphosphaera apsteinii, Strain RCC1455" /LENGTH=84 /DNA_ID=CAMNT_0007301285 /DNA_START=672 /DNA_END=926 /DNA_ORIENTATION=+